MIEQNTTKRKPRGKKIVRREIKPKKIIREPKIVGYMRVSTEHQDHTLQYDALTAAGVKDENIYKDTISGSKISRIGLEKCLKSLEAGDVLVVWKIDRLSRKLYDMVDMMRDLEKRNVGFKSLTQDIDTTVPSGRMMLHILFIFAEFERETIRERVKAGIKAKRDSGEITQWGRKPKIEYDEHEILKMLKNQSIREVSRLTGVPKSTVNLIKQRGKK